ncbi:MAG: cytochrome b N-terminal domain-containing protein, partial [Chloroflexi bacterium]|nr:cytochrome b N-terminal domain-containing protein [Chloroflexota bacterium]
MNLFFRRILLGTVAFVLVAALLLIFAHQSQARAYEPNWELARESAGLPSEKSSEVVPSLLASLPPPPKQDPCLHCHIAGEEKGLWTPVARWVIFGSAGLVLVFGVVQASSMRKTRSPWKPLMARAGEWIDERYEISDPLSKMLAKPVPDWQRRWWYCLGGITAFLFIVQGITGVMLAFYYQPTPEAAYASIQFIETEVRFGAAIRMIHHWSANGMIVMCTAHMLRVFIMGAYKKPRELNWVSGVSLLVLTLAFGLSGYLLPWVQRAYWA